MSNLRNDCRDLVRDLPAGDTHKVHILALCNQVDTLEESWHAAERKARDLQARVDLWEWLTSMGCVVRQNSAIGSPAWTVFDVDGDQVGSGYSPEDAIKNAMNKISAMDVSDFINRRK